MLLADIMYLLTVCVQTWTCVTQWSTAVSTSVWALQDRTTASVQRDNCCRRTARAAAVSRLSDYQFHIKSHERSVMYQLKGIYQRVLYTTDSQFTILQHGRSLRVKTNNFISMFSLQELGALLQSQAWGGLRSCGSCRTQQKCCRMQMDGSASSSHSS